jgi:hypothetical protein
MMTARQFISALSAPSSTDPEYAQVGLTETRAREGAT